MLTASTLGTLRFLRDGLPIASPAKREAALLLHVAYEWPRQITRESLAAMFWPDSSERHGLHSVSQALYRLSSALPGLRFETRQRSVAVRPEVLSLDVQEFRRFTSSRDWHSAGELYRGVFLPELTLPDAPEFDLWLDRARAQVAGLAEEVFRHLLSGAEDAGDWTASERAATELLQLNPLDQAAAVSGIEALLARGLLGQAAAQHSAALKRIRDAGDALVPRLAELGARTAAGATEVDAPPSYTIPFIGRSAEFAELKRLIAAAQNGQPTTAVISGRAGIGKSRLSDQVLRLAAVRGFRILRSRCSPELSNAPYAAVRQLFSGVVTQDTDSVPVDTFSTLAHLLPASVSARLAPGATDEQPRDWLYESAATLVRACAERAPVVLSLEDVHWLDSASAELLSHVRASLTDERILVVATARPEELAKHNCITRLGSGPTDALLNLQELNSAEVDELIGAFARTDGHMVPGEVAAAVRRRAGGSPYFILELLRNWANSPEQQFNGDESLPRTVEQFLSSRFAALTPRALGVAAALAVLGGRAEAVPIAHVAALSDEEVADAVDELASAGLIRDVDNTVEFLHDLVREAAYRRLGGTRRRMLHARAVRALRGLPGVDVGALAVHSAIAGDHEAACRFSLAAAERATARFGHREAETYWRMALAHASHSATRQRCLYGLGHCLYRSDRSVEAYTHLAELLSDVNLPHNIRTVASAEKMALSRSLARHVDSECEIPKLIVECGRLSSARDRIRTANAILYVLASGSSNAIVDLYLSELAAIVDGADPSTAKARALSHLTFLYWVKGDQVQSKRGLAGHTALCSSYGPYWLARSKAQEAVLLLLEGQLRSADEAFASAYALVESAGHGLEPAELGNWAVVKLEMGDLNGAGALLDSYIAWANSHGSAYLLSIAESNYAWLEYEQGRYHAALSHARATLTAGEAAIPDCALTLSSSVIALFELESGGDVRSLAEKLGALVSGDPAFGSDTSYAEIFLARMSEREGKVEEALGRLQKAIDWYDGRDFFCHGRLVLEKARLIALTDREAGLTLAREVRARAVEAEGVLLMNKAESLMRELKRAEPAPAGRKRPAGRTKAGAHNGR